MGVLRILHIGQAGDLGIGRLSNRSRPDRLAEDPPGVSAPGGSSLARMPGIQPGDEGPSTRGSSFAVSQVSTENSPGASGTWGVSGLDR